MEQQDSRARPGPLQVGRYVVLEPIARGGMGEVVRAYDPKLQREVALKKLRPTALDVSRARFEQEARAMAKLSHPNVVAVYDVEVQANGELVMVMEYVHGPTLRTWVEGAPRPWREVLQRFQAAGRGLRAAHDVGILHRDFKPSNVLLTGDSAKVADFGLAKHTLECPVGTQPTPTDAICDAVEDTDLTRPGRVVGTPRYMAPEQHRGKELSPAVDQFAFCVALWEALAGEPPYAGPRLIRHKHQGPPRWPSRAGPRWVGEALRRGLSPDPAKRWPSMDALLHALARQPTVLHRSPATLAGMTGLVLGTGSWAFGSQWQQPNPCSGGALALAPQWGDPVQAQVRESMLGVDVPYAASVWSRAQSQLDAYAADWVDVHTDACEAHARQEQSDTLMDLRIGCLDEARTELAAVVNVLGDADVDVLRSADGMLEELPDLKRCSNLAALQRGAAPPPPNEAPALAAARHHIATGRALRAAGRLDDGLRELGHAQAAVEHLDHPVVEAELELEWGLTLERQGDYPGAELALRGALNRATTARDWDLMAPASAALLQVLGHARGRFHEALALREVVEGTAGEDPLAIARAKNAVGLAMAGAARYEAAEALLSEVVAIRAQALGSAHRQVAFARNNLATVLNKRGKRQAAEAEYRAVIALLRARLGDDHPDVASARSNLACLLRARGRLAEAERQIRLALAVRRRSLGDRHFLVGSAQATLSEVLADQRRFAAAEAEARAGYARVEATLGAEHPRTVGVLNSRGRIYAKQGRFEQAEAIFREVVALRAADPGPEHPSVAFAQMNVAVALRRQGRLDEAAAEYSEARRLLLEVLGPDHPDLAGLHNNLGLVLLDLHRPAEAERELQRALELDRRHLDPSDPAALEVRGNLALALEQLGQLDAAVTERRAVVKGLQVARDEDDPDLAIARCSLADTLLERDAPDVPDEALALARLAYERVRADSLTAEERGTLRRCFALGSRPREPHPR